MYISWSIQIIYMITEMFSGNIHIPWLYTSTLTYMSSAWIDSNFVLRLHVCHQFCDQYWNSSSWKSRLSKMMCIPGNCSLPLLSPCPLFSVCCELWYNICINLCFVFFFNTLKKELAFFLLIVRLYIAKIFFISITV